MVNDQQLEQAVESYSAEPPETPQMGINHDNVALELYAVLVPEHCILMYKVHVNGK